MQPVAAIDVGTNTVLMLVARPAGVGAFEVVEDHAVITRLGRGVDESGRLSEDAIEVTLAALTGFGKRARELGARVGAVGTSALRDAANATALLGPAARVLGAPIDIVSGPREAELSFAGAMHGLAVSGATLVDVGGGSTEVARAGADGGIRAESVDIGTVRLFDRVQPGAPTSSDEVATLRAAATDAFDASGVSVDAPLVACGGTATTLAAVAHAVTPYDPAKIHGLRLGAAQVDEWLDRLAALPLEGRRALPGMTPGREDLLVAGAAILSTLCARAGADALTVSNGGVRTGLALEIIEKTAIDPNIAGT